MSFGFVHMSVLIMFIYISISCFDRTTSNPSSPCIVGADNPAFTYPFCWQNEQQPQLSPHHGGRQSGLRVPHGCAAPGWHKRNRSVFRHQGCGEKRRRWDLRSRTRWWVSQYVISRTTWPLLFSPGSEACRQRQVVFSYIGIFIKCIGTGLFHSLSYTKENSKFNFFTKYR